MTSVYTVMCLVGYVHICRQYSTRWWHRLAWVANWTITTPSIVNYCWLNYFIWSIIVKFGERLIHCAVLIFTYIKEINIEAPLFHFCESPSVHEKCGICAHREYINCRFALFQWSWTLTHSRIGKEEVAFFSVQGTKGSTKLIITIYRYLWLCSPLLCLGCFSVS